MRTKKTDSTPRWLGSLNPSRILRAVHQVGIVWDQRLLYCICLLLNYAVGQAQQPTLNPFGQAIIGGSAVFERTLQLDWSIGEAPAIETRTLNSRFQCSMGFLQSKNEVISLYKTLDSFNISIQIGPNPFEKVFWIRCKQEGIVITRIQLLNPLGKLTILRTSPIGGIHFEQQVNLSDAVKGVYYIFIQYLIDENKVQEKIFKLLEI